MKFTYPVFSLFLFSIIYTRALFLHSADAADLPEPVLDINGEKLQVGANYYIMSAIRGGGGGGVAQGSPGGFQICPQAVVQLQSEFQRGDRVNFKPANSSEGVVRLHSDLNIKFNTFTICILSTTVWTVQHNDAVGEDFIMTGGVEGKPGADTINNWFKIEKYKTAYKISFCPSVCASCPVTRCRDIGISFDYGRSRRLILRDEDHEVRFPFMVVFVKVSSV